MASRKHYNTEVFSDRTGERIVSPGEILTKELRRQHVTQKELARMLGRSEKFISQLITGKVRLTYDVAFDLERTLGYPTYKWNAAEASFQDALTRKERRAELDTPAAAEWVAGFPYQKMVEAQLVPKADAPADKADNLLRYFGVASIAAYDDCAAQAKGFARFKDLQAKADALR